MNETEKENVKEAEEEEEERHLGERAKKKKKKKKQKKKKERGAARRSARSSSGERRRAATAGRGERSDICDFSFFSTAGVSEPRRSHSEPCQSRVGEAKKKKKKRHSPDTGIRRVVPVPVSNMCPTLTRRQKWRVRAT